MATAMTAAAVASERRRREVRAHVHRTALATVDGRVRGAGRGLRGGALVVAAEVHVLELAGGDASVARGAARGAGRGGGCRRGCGRCGGGRGLLPSRRSSGGLASRGGGPGSARGAARSTDLVGGRRRGPGRSGSGRGLLPSERGGGARASRSSGPRRGQRAGRGHRVGQPGSEEGEALGEGRAGVVVGGSNFLPLGFGTGLVFFCLL